jgi:hypothetical protein
MERVLLTGLGVKWKVRHVCCGTTFLRSIDRLKVATTTSLILPLRRLTLEWQV